MKLVKRRITSPRMRRPTPQKSTEPGLRARRVRSHAIDPSRFGPLWEEA